MPHTDAPARRTDRIRALAQTYRRFADSAAAGTSPLAQRIASALSRSDAALRALAAAPARARRPAQLLAALGDLALAGRAPALAAAVAAGDPDAVAEAAIATLLADSDAVVAVAARRPTAPDERGRCAVLHPAIAEAARRLGATTVGLVDVGCGAGLNLSVGRVRVRYGNGQTVGDPASPVQQTAEVVGERPLPTAAFPRVAARIGVDTEPLDVRDPDVARWLRACVWPDRRERRAGLEAELALAAADPPLLLWGGLVETLPDAVARVPADAVPVVTTIWTLSRLPLEQRLRFLDRLVDAAARRPLAWVSVEGVGVAPAVPTFGDRRASGHSIIGVALLEPSGLRVEAVGRCWSRGRLLAWLADAGDGDG